MEVLLENRTDAAQTVGDAFQVPISGWFFTHPHRLSIPDYALLFCDRLLALKFVFPDCLSSERFFFTDPYSSVFLTIKYAGLPMGLSHILAFLRRQADAEVASLVQPRLTPERILRSRFVIPCSSAHLTIAFESFCLTLGSIGRPLHFWSVSR